MAIRCRNYDDDKKPIGRGCRLGDACRYVHPNNPIWEQARKGSNSNSFTSRPRQSESFGRSEPVKRTSASWGNAPAFANAAQSPETGSRWGSNQAQAGSSKAPIDYPGKTVQPVAWGVAAPPEASSRSPKWGDPSAEEWRYSTNASGGWPEDSSGKTSGWGDSGGGTGWGTENNNVPEDKGKQKEDVNMRDPSPPPRMPIPLPPPRNFRRESQVVKPDLPPLRIDAKSSWSQSSAQSPVPTPTPTTSKAIVPAPRNKARASLPPAGNLKKMALELSATKTAQETGNVYIQDNSDTQSPAPPEPKNYTGPMGRVALYADNLRCLQDLVVSSVISQRAQRDLERWKRTHNSETYSHATPLTREFLESHASEYKKKLFNANKNQETALKALVALPEFAPRGKVIDSKITKEVVAGYTAELREWFMDLQVHKRLLLERDAGETKAKENGGDSQPTSGTASEERRPPQPTAQELLKRGNWTWRELKNATDMLESRILSTTEHVYSEVFTRCSDLDDQLQRIPDAMEVEDVVESGPEHSAGDLHRSITRVGDNLGAQAVRAADLFKRIEELQTEIDIVVAEKTKMDEICAQAELKFQEFEQSKQTHTTEIRDLAEKLQKLHLQKRLRQSPSSPPPVKIDDIVEYVRPFILKRMETEMAPVFEALRKRCIENQENVAKELEELVKPAVDMTDAICQRVMSMTLVQASAKPSA